MTRQLDLTRIVQDIFTYWQTELGKPRCRLTTERRAKIIARLKHYTVSDLKYVIDVVKYDPFWRGDNERNTPYDDIVNIFRNDTRVEQFLLRDDVQKDLNAGGETQSREF